PLGGTVVILDGQGTSALTYTWLATSCAVPQDTLDLTINRVTVMQVLPELNGMHCSCTPPTSTVEVPLADALALLGPGVNQLGIRKSTGLPGHSRSTLAWAYATITVGGTAQRVDIFDETGGNDFDHPDLCAAGSTFDAIDMQADSPPLPAPALSVAGADGLPCGLDLSALAPGSYALMVSATDGTVASPPADLHVFDKTSQTMMAFAGTSCDDGNPCTIDECTPAGCTHTPVTCAAVDQCHDATCDPATGQCSSTAKPDGAACNDGNACTQTDTCQGGVCTGTNPVTYAAADQCHEAATCDPATGRCSSPAKLDGAACNDGNACTKTHPCHGGFCPSPNPVLPAAADDCCHAATCDPATGQCSSPAKPDGAACNDGNACTQTDTCQGGVCTGTNPVTCAAADQCHDAGTCDPATGLCSSPAKPDGAACTDGNACTQPDPCQGGVCTGTNPVTCAAADQCHDAGTCDPATGRCSSPVRPDGSACDDGDACTHDDACEGGACGGVHVLCVAADQCHTIGSCDPATGQCSNPAKQDGASCDDGNTCTRTDMCHGGVCIGTNPVVCAARDDCHAAFCTRHAGCRVRRTRARRFCARHPGRGRG